MTEYIEREALLKKHCKEPSKGDCKHCDWYGDTWCRGKLHGVQIADFPAADVAPVRHGRWIDGEDNYGSYVTCSTCKEDFVCWEADCVRTNYCPNCGAKMDGGDGE